jgi:mono/diheme cytochrome c family protein
MRRYVGTLPLVAVTIALSTAVFSENATPSTNDATSAVTTKDAKTSKDAASGAIYTVQGDGTKVDAQTLSGWKTWRALACERCHGAEQEGMVGPSLVDSLKKLSKEDFHTVIMNGRIEKGMPPFNGSAMMQKNWEGLYAYLKGRSDGKIKPGRLSEIEK